MSKKLSISTLKRSIRTNWWIYSANKESKTSVLFNRILLLATPPLVGFGIFLALFHLIPVFPLLPSLVAGITTSILIGYYMVRSSPEIDEHVDAFLNEEDLINLTHKYNPTPSPSKVQPAFYQGVGEWMAPGHVPIKEFIESIQSVDQFVDSIEYPILEDSVEYSYAVNTFSPRRKTPALRITSKKEEDSYPITRLKAPYDNYVTQKGYPKNSPPVPALPSDKFDIPSDLG